MSRPFLKPWRAQSAGGITRIAPAEPFDELVVGDWLHVEVMDDRHTWMRVGPLTLNVSRHRGVFRIRIDADADDVPAVVTVDGPIEGPTREMERAEQRQRILKAYERARGQVYGKPPTRERLLEELRRVGWGS